ncbi:MAG: hypothetical protein ALAOOOJD_00094 [bacterium]|nr:hypothetical protein [bacterium]
MKQAIGLAVSGTEVRLAHLVNHNGQIKIQGLERARLKTTLESRQPDEQKAKAEEGEGKDAFGLKENLGDKESSSGYVSDSGNLEIIFRLLEKYTKQKTKIAFNVPLSMVNYQRQDLAATTVERKGDASKDMDSSLGHELIKAHDGATLKMTYEKLPPTMVLMQDVNGFLKGNLFLALMDSTEVALANLARRSNELDAGKVTAIVYIEDDFTRLVFLRGKDLFHVSSVIHDNTASPDILEVIYRKLLYELDEAKIPEISAIMLAGKSNRIDAANFFATYFPTVKVAYLSSDAMAGMSAAEMQRGTFSEFAVPISLAWKTLDPKSPFFIPTNLLPQDLLDQQQVLKLNYHGYILLALTGLVAFFTAWQIGKLRTDINLTRAKNSHLERQISSNQTTVDHVFALDDQCKRLSKNLELSDSLGRGHDEFLAFLKKLNASVERAGNVWVDEIVKRADGFSVKGSSLSRETIPLFAEKLENANLRQVTRVENGKRKSFRFDLERGTVSGAIKTAEQGLSNIDDGRYASNGKFIISKDGAPADFPPTTSTKQDDSLTNQPTVINPARDDAKLSSRNATPPPPVVRETTAAKSANGRANSGAVNQPAPVLPTRKPETPAANERTKIEDKPAAKFAEKKSTAQFAENQPAAKNGEAKTPGVMEKSNSGTISAESKTTSKRVANNFTPPAAAGAERPNVSKSLSTAESSSPAVPPSTVSKPMDAPPEIYRGYSIEAATSHTKGLAEQFAVAYRKQGHDAAVESYYDERTGTTRYRVLVGIFNSRPAAEKKAAQMAGLLMKDYRVVGMK